MKDTTLRAGIRGEKGRKESCGMGGVQSGIMMLKHGKEATRKEIKRGVMGNRNPSWTMGKESNFWKIS